jgi:uncharacterized protein (TIGR02391 family)
VYNKYINNETTVEASYMSSYVKMLNITPHVSLFPKLGRVRFTVTTALPELVDNAIDRRVQDVHPVVVEIRFDRMAGLIEVADNASGLDEDKLEKALTIGFSPEDEEQDRIGENGFGLKAAASFMAHSFRIVTRRVGTNTTLEVDFNEAAFIRGGAWQLACRVSEDLIRPTHGTTISMRDLKVDLAAIKDEDVITHLATIYRTYLQDKLLLLWVNGQLVEPLTIDRLPPPAPFKKISFTVAGKLLVHGWVGARSPMGVLGNDKGGFELFRRGRMIGRRGWVGVRGTSRRRHMVGELHLDEFEVNNNKTDFIRDTQEWIEFEGELAKELKGFDVYEETKLTKFKRDTPGDQTPIAGSISPISVRVSVPTPSPAPPHLPTHLAGPSATPPGAPPSPSSRRPVLTGHLKFRPPKRDSLSLTDLHPRIRLGCEHLFRSGDLSVAVQQAFTIVNKYVRERTGITDDKGKDMMWQVFSRESSKVPWVKAKLHFSDFTTESQRSEQDGFTHIFSGAQLGIRNPVTHTGIHLSEEEALEYMAFASLLCRRIEGAKVIPT